VCEQSRRIAASIAAAKPAAPPTSARMSLSSASRSSTCLRCKRGPDRLADLDQQFRDLGQVVARSAEAQRQPVAQAADIQRLQQQGARTAVEREPQRGGRGGGGGSDLRKTHVGTVVRQRDQQPRAGSRIEARHEVCALFERPVGAGGGKCQRPHRRPGNNVREIALERPGMGSRAAQSPPRSPRRSRSRRR